MFNRRPGGFYRPCSVTSGQSSSSSSYQNYPLSNSSQSSGYQNYPGKSTPSQNGNCSKNPSSHVPENSPCGSWSPVPADGSSDILPPQTGSVESGDSSNKSQEGGVALNSDLADSKTSNNFSASRQTKPDLEWRSPASDGSTNTESHSTDTDLEKSSATYATHYFGASSPGPCGNPSGPFYSRQHPQRNNRCQQENTCPPENCGNHHSSLKRKNHKSPESVESKGQLGLFSECVSLFKGFFTNDDDTLESSASIPADSQTTHTAKKSQVRPSSKHQGKRKGRTSSTCSAASRDSEHLQGSEPTLIMINNINIYMETNGNVSSYLSPVASDDEAELCGPKREKKKRKRDRKRKRKKCSSSSSSPPCRSDRKSHKRECRPWKLLDWMKKNAHAHAEEKIDPGHADAKYADDTSCETSETTDSSVKECVHSCAKKMFKKPPSSTSTSPSPDRKRKRRK